MTRGKYAVRAETRRDDAEHAAEIASYQHAIRKLTAESKAAREKADEKITKLNRHLALVIAQRDAGTSEALEAAHDEIRHLREQLTRANVKGAKITAMWDRVWKNLGAYARNDLGMTGLESVEWVVGLVGKGDAYTLVDDGAEARMGERYGSAAVRKFQRASGQRRGA